MHDARAFESAGRPCSAVISSGFVPQARYQAKLLDAADIPQIFVAHPISDQTRAQMAEKAENTFDKIRAAISHPWSPTSIDAVSSGAKESDDKEECST